MSKTTDERMRRLEAKIGRLEARVKGDRAELAEARKVLAQLREEDEIRSRNAVIAAAAAKAGVPVDDSMVDAIAAAILSCAAGARRDAEAQGSDTADGDEPDDASRSEYAPPAPYDDAEAGAGRHNVAAPDTDGGGRTAGPDVDGACSERL